MVARPVPKLSRLRSRPNAACDNGLISQWRKILLSWASDTSTLTCPRRCKGTVTCILVRVGADLSSGGGFWNAPVDSATSDFVYVAIPEASPVHAGLEKPYERLTSPLAEFNVALPNHLKSQQMHLDPDFEHLTYGDTGQKAKQLKDNLRTDDIVCFYAGLRDVHDSPRLI